MMFNSASFLPSGWQLSYEVETVHDGSQGLERALSMQHALVVLDLMLPGMGGLDVLRRLRTVSPVPVLILTAGGKTRTESWGWRWARTITFPNHLTRGNSSPASAPSCGEQPDRPLPDP